MTSARARWLRTSAPLHARMCLVDLHYSIQKDRHSTHARREEHVSIETSIAAHTLCSCLSVLTFFVRL